MSWKLHGCTRCNGDTVIDKDSDGWFEQCILCGYRRDLVLIKQDQTPENHHAKVPHTGIANNTNKK